jgi:hypothetical protein
MGELHKSRISGENIEPREGQRELLCSNKFSNRCPSFGINPNQVSEDIALDYLASILVEAFLNKKKNEFTKSRKTKTSSNICPGIHQGTSG